VTGQDAVKQDRQPRAAAGRLRRMSRAVQPFLAESWLNGLGAVIVVLILLLAVFGPLLAPQNPDQVNLLAVLQPPSVNHWFGTDSLGRDIFSQVLAGARISIEVAVIILSLSVVFGTALGIMSGLAGGLVDEIIMRITDLFLAFPGFILAAAIAATLGPSLQHTVLALAVVFWPWYTRLIRGQVLSLREREFVLAARVARAGTMWIATRHLARNVLAILIVQVSLDVGYAILATSSLSFLGLGAQPPSPEWGALIASGRSYIQTAWWWTVFPGLALALTVLGFNLLGDGLRDWIDPRLRGSLVGGVQE
jgi:peptide/nickel transport system permease protein